MARNDPIVRLTDASLFVGEKNRQKILAEHINVSISPGDRIALVGPNGSGKSTLIKAILGRRSLSQGAYDSALGICDIGYLPQEFRKGLFPWLSLQQNVDIYRRGSAEFDYNWFVTTMDKFELKLDLKGLAANLSGGETQLLSLALVLSQRRALVVLDEPLSAIDFKRKKIARSVIKQRLEDLQLICIVVSHYIEDIMALSTKAWVFSRLADQPTRQELIEVYRSNDLLYREVFSRIFGEEV